MPLWQRALATLAVIVVVSWGIGAILLALLGFTLPSYAAGVIGGIAAVPTWEFLSRVGPRPDASKGA